MSDTNASATPAPANPAPVNPLEQTQLPDKAWLDGIEGEVEDVDRVLKCLSRESMKMCATCVEVAAGEGLASRPVLERCASTKQG